MATEDFTYRRECTRSFPDAVEAVERSVRLHGFAVVRRHDLQATLAAKGFEIQPLTILDVAIGEGDEHLCKLHVYAEGDAVWVTAIRPTVLWNVIEPATEAVSCKAESTVVAVVDDAVR